MSSSSRTRSDAFRGRQGLVELLRPTPVLRRGELAHGYLENRLSRLSEGTLAKVLEERPELGEELRGMLAEMNATFIAGYDPRPFVLHLTPLLSLRAETRQRLDEVLQREFVARFRPEERLAALREKGGCVLEALQAWRNKVRRDGVGPNSTPLWHALRERTDELLELLRDPELRTRWIP